MSSNSNNDLLSGLNTDGFEEQEDFIPKEWSLPTNIYDMQVKYIFLGKSPKGARFATFVVKAPNNEEYTFPVYYTNREGKNFYERESKKYPMPGYAIMDEFAQIYLKKQFPEISLEEKVIPIYDYDAKKEIPKEMPVIKGFFDKPVKMALIQEKQNKSNGQGTILRNNVHKIIYTDNKTLSELKNNRDPIWANKWQTKMQDVVIDKTTSKNNKQNNNNDFSDDIPW